MSLRKHVCGRVFVVLALLLSSVALAQETPFPKVELYGGYSWTDPGGEIGPIGTTSTIGPTIRLGSMPKGFNVAATWNMNQWVGWTLQAGGHFDDPADIGTVMFGPQFKWHAEQFQPFVHGLVGLHRLGPQGFSTDNGVGIKVGGGFDIPINRAISLRLLQAEYVWAHHNFFPTVVRGTNLAGAEIGGGIVLNFAYSETGPPPSASCSAQPTAVMAGEPVTVNVNAQNFNPKHTLAYSYSATQGVKVDGTAATARVDTAGLSPGQYTVNATVTDARMKKNGTVQCSAQFTINEPPKNPPTISCTAEPTTVRAGDAVNITSTATNPDNRPLTYTYQASAGRITGNGTTATLDTAGAPAGPITVNCTVSDDRGLTATNSTTATVEVPPPPPTASKMSECSFPDKRRPGRVDNACKAVLDDVALRLQREADSKLVIVGQADPSERRAEQLAAERAVNSKAYLTRGEAQQQIDPTRIEVRTGTGGGQRAEYWIVPSGATFNEPGTQMVDESTIKAPAKRRRR